MNKEIDDLIEKSNEIESQIVEVGVKLFDSFYDEFLEIPTVKKHKVNLFIALIYTTDDEGKESFYPSLNFIKDRDPAEVKEENKKRKRGSDPVLSFYCQEAVDTSLAEFLTDCFEINAEDIIPEDVRKADNSITQIEDFIRHYQDNKWLEDICSNSIIPNKFLGDY